MRVQKIPPDKCSICPLCPFYRACNVSPVLVPYDREQTYEQRIDAYRAAVFQCTVFIDRMIDS